jgi:glycosyltransferase involved in cell wall biosynthesis
VARDLVAALDPELVPLLDPLGGERSFSVPIPANLSPEHGRKGHLARLLWTQNQLPGLVKASGAPLLLSPLPEAPLGRGVRSVVLAHDLLPLRYPQLSPLLAYHLAYVPLVLHRAVRVLCNSEATAREVHGRLGVPLRRLVPLRLGFDPGRLRPLHLEREPFFLVLGRHDPHKNLMGVLRAFAALPDPARELRLKLVGPHDERYTPRLQNLAQDLGIGPRCDWLAWVSDAERLALLNRCRALVMVSFWEGFGLPALEAMACETPVIAARAGALPEVVGDAADMVFMAVGNDHAADALLILPQISGIRQHHIDPMHAIAWESEARIHKHQVVAIFKNTGVFTDFMQSPEGNDPQGRGFGSGQMAISVGIGHE